MNYYSYPDDLEQTSQLPIYRQPNPHTPLPPMAHTRPLTMPPDQLSDHRQRMIEQYCNAIFMLLGTQCRCEKCTACLRGLLSDYLAECMTDQNMLMHSIEKFHKSFDRLNTNIERLLPLLEVRI